MNDLRDRLARLGLSQYYDVFAAEGFDSWDTVLDITESDLSHLNVKLGHRRKIQRAIAESRGQSSDRPLPITLGRTNSVEASYRSDDSGGEGKNKPGESSTATPNAPGTKRKYRRHPKPDEHAPERPPSAYVIFSNHVRESLKGQDLTFTEIAKVVGERWQVLPAAEREACERQANTAKERYYAELAEYKKTSQYESYQKYLEDFRQKHAAPLKGKRSKLETETSTSTRSSSHDQLERGGAANRRVSSAQPETGQFPEPSPPVGSARLPAGSYPSKPTSPASRSLPSMQSPRMSEYYSPVSASPRSAMMQKELVSDMATTNLNRESSRGSGDSNAPYHPPAYPESARQPNSTTPPSYGYPPQFHPQLQSEMSQRRGQRDPTRLPPLTHEDTTLSSESGQSGYGPPPTGYSVQAPPTDSIKTMRTLPQPVPSIGPPASHLDRPPATAPTPQLPLPATSHDYRTQGGLAVLLRAGELASQAADDEQQPKEGSP